MYKTRYSFKSLASGTSLVLQWLRLHTSNAGHRFRFLVRNQSSQKVKKKKKKIKKCSFYFVLSILLPSIGNLYDL